MLIATNTPFNTVNNPLTQKVFQSHVKSGGALPCSQQLYPYVHDIYTVEKESLQSKIQDCQIVIIFDETVDDFGLKVCSVMFSLITKLNKPCILSYVASVYFEKAALNYNRVAQLVLKLYRNILSILIKLSVFRQITWVICLNVTVKC